MVDDDPAWHGLPDDGLRPGVGRPVEVAELAPLYLELISPGGETTGHGTGFVMRDAHRAPYLVTPENTVPTSVFASCTLDDQRRALAVTTDYGTDPNDLQSRTPCLAVARSRQGFGYAVAVAFLAGASAAGVVSAAE
ncbi:hypothetical protein SAMN05216223_11634 [Actinacidiphila yanglinensis]|uniref:Uncharacterized protein n=1 Tax=Actinacidiphila yanglinensis TaxID=310779 RepID=A0A1H6DL45_9ACTN|nr:hypothetical protein [Actinacidiphila yanglinensis]SEG85315.1 hypothetical protein SAMN05216223_11634 [Actinacidiphila yanglinensis]